MADSCTAASTAAKLPAVTCCSQLLLLLPGCLVAEAVLWVLRGCRILLWTWVACGGVLWELNGACCRCCRWWGLKGSMLEGCGGLECGLHWMGSAPKVYDLARVWRVWLQRCGLIRACHAARRLLWNRSQTNKSSNRSVEVAEHKTRGPLTLCEEYRLQCNPALCAPLVAYPPLTSPLPPVSPSCWSQPSNQQVCMQ